MQREHMLSNFPSVTDRITSLFREQMFLCQLFLSAPRNYFFLPIFRVNSHLPISFSYSCSVLWVQVMFHQFVDNSSRTEWIMSNNPTTPFSWRSCIRCHLHRCTPVLLRSRDCLDLTPIHTSTQLHTGPFPSWGSHTVPFWWRLLSPWSR